MNIRKSEFTLRLFGVQGSDSTRRARDNLLRWLPTVGADIELLEFVDVLSEPQRAFDEGVLVTPTLVIVVGDGRRHVIVGTVDDVGPLTRIFS